MNISSKTTGLVELNKYMDGLVDAPKIHVRCVPTGWHSAETSKRGKGTPSRPNAMIFAAQAKYHDRDPSFLDPADDSAGMSLVVDMANAWMGRRPEAIMAAARRLGALFVDAVKRHIAEGRSDGGKPMKPLTSVYSEIKKWKWNAADKPILVRTGELLESIQARISVRGGRR